VTVVEPVTRFMDRRWYQRRSVEVAPDLLGAFITTNGPGGRVAVRITEVEAYAGADDPVSHAYRGRSARNAAMFGEPGRLYVYRHLGLHHCVNVVCDVAGTAAGVLLRAGEVVDGIELARARRLAAGSVRSDNDLARGPARLTVALGLDLTAIGEDVTEPGGRVALFRREPATAAPSERGPRVGVGVEGADPQRFSWRWWIPGDPTVSSYRPSARTVRRAPKGDAPPALDRADWSRA